MRERLNVVRRRCAEMTVLTASKEASVNRPTAYSVRAWADSLDTLLNDKCLYNSYYYYYCYYYFFDPPCIYVHISLQFTSPCGVTSQWIGLSVAISVQDVGITDTNLYSQTI